MQDLLSLAKLTNDRHRNQPAEPTEDENENGGDGVLQNTGLPLGDRTRSDRLS